MSPGGEVGENVYPPRQEQVCRATRTVDPVRSARVSVLACVITGPTHVPADCVSPHLPSALSPGSR